MAGYIKAEGLDKLGSMLQQLGDKAEDVAKAGLYAGAGTVANAMSQAVNGIRTEPFRYAHHGRQRLASPEEVEALRGKTGIARFRGGGSEVNTLIGFQNAGYAEINGKRKAVAVIARSINSGTSFMQKQPVFRRAASQARGAATEAVVQAAEAKIKEITR